MFLDCFALIFSFLATLLAVSYSLFELFVKQTTELVKKRHSWYFNVVCNIDVHFTFLRMLFVCVFMNVIYKLFEQMTHQM